MKKSVEELPVTNGAKGVLYHISGSINVEVSQNPEKDDGNLYWKYQNTLTGETIWRLIWPTDDWEPND